MLLRGLVLLSSLCCCTCAQLCEGETFFTCAIDKGEPADSECATLVEYYTEVIDDCVRPNYCCEVFSSGFNSNNENANTFRECASAQKTIDSCEKPPVISAAPALLPVYSVSAGAAAALLLVLLH